MLKLKKASYLGVVSDENVEEWRVPTTGTDGIKNLCNRNPIQQFGGTTKVEAKRKQQKPQSLTVSTSLSCKSDVQIYQRNANYIPSS